MDEFGDIKELKVKDSDAVLTVEGYDISLRADDVYYALKKHFASCGQITDIFVPNCELFKLKRRACISIRGECAEEKALELSGTDVGGWTVVVSKGYTDPEGDEEEPRVIVVTGYDTWLCEDDIENGISNYFSSCGEVLDIFIPNDRNGLLGSKAWVTMMGKSAIEKAQKLSGSKMGGWKFEVVKVIPSHGPRYLRGRLCG